MDFSKLPVKPTPELGIFLLLAGIAMASAVGVIFFRNAIRSALCLVLNFFVLAFLYFTLNCEMLGIVQIVVYTGAIMVLFLFVIMLLNLGAIQTDKDEKLDIKLPVGIMLGLGLFALIASQIVPQMIKIQTPKAPDNFGSPQAVGNTLFSNYLYPFEIASILLLVGIVGSILLAKRRLNP
jgi:NADH-quinone oxidoreductase subunit J